MEKTCGSRILMKRDATKKTLKKAWRWAERNEGHDTAAFMYLTACSIVGNLDEVPAEQKFKISSHEAAVIRDCAFALRDAMAHAIITMFREDPGSEKRAPPAPPPPNLPWKWSDVVPLEPGTA